MTQIFRKKTQRSCPFYLLFCIVVLTGLTGGCAVISNGRSGWRLYSKYSSCSEEENIGRNEAESEVADKEKPAPAAEPTLESESKPAPAAEPAPESTSEAVSAPEEKSSFGDKLLWYLPNRICDLVDCFTIEIGGGPNARLDLHLTQACCLGAGYGNEYLFGWDRRFFGGEKRFGEFDSIGYKADLFYLDVEKRDINNVFGSLPSYSVNHSGVVDINAPEYESKKRDFWALGIDLGLLYNVKVEIHPVAIADFIAGLFFIDIEKDDYAPTPDEY